MTKYEQISVRPTKAESELIDKAVKKVQEKNPRVKRATFALEAVLKEVKKVLGETK